MSKKRSIETTCIQGGWQPGNGEPRQVPIYQSTTFKYSTSEAMGKLFDLEAEGYFYTRLQNPTNDAVAAKICEMEGGAAAMLTSSGQAANFYAVMNIAQEGDVIHVTRPNDEKEARSLHGLTRTIIHNMVVGVTEGFKKDLEIQGVGYRAAKQGNKLVLTLGFSHPVEVEETDTIKIELKDALHFSIVGIDKQEVGQFAAEVRGKRPPEPYKGKGIRYVGEYVIRKEGKAGKGK